MSDEVVNGTPASLVPPVITIGKLRGWTVPEEFAARIGVLMTVIITPWSV